MTERPDHLEWVYIYIDEEDKNYVGYVGRSMSLPNCLKRLRDHRKAKWYPTARWNIALCPCLNRCESEHIETLLINTLFPRWNVDKVGWGINCEPPKIDDMIIIKENLIDFPNNFLKGLKSTEQLIINAYLEAHNDI